MVSARIHALILRIMTYEKSPRKLAFTCALGVYIGISPWVGLHTVMVFVLGWMFALSIPVLFLVSAMIHNPWTMMPVYAFDHFFGTWVFSYCGIDGSAWDPAWIESWNVILKAQTGISGFSLAAFFVGGNLLAIGTSVMLYPVMKRVFARYLKSNTPNTSPAIAFKVTYENNISKQKSLS